MSDTKPTKLDIIKAPKLKSFDDAKTAAELLKLFSEAQKGLRLIAAVGIAAWEIKETQLKHGEFGAWLSAHAPKLARIDDKTGKPKASSALTTYMQLTKGVLENCGFTLNKYFEHVAKFPHAGICKAGKFLLIPDKKVPEDVKPLREQICSLIDGKTKSALFLEFKQAEEDDEGTAKPKRGQLKGSKGLTKEQREAAAARAEQERIEDLEVEAEETAALLLDKCDDKNFGMIDEGRFNKFAKAVQYAHDYCQRVQQMRKG